MKEEVRWLIDKAAESIDAARTLLAQSHVEFAAARAYYAMFYTAEALLSHKGLRFTKHGGVHAAFGEQFAKPGVLDAKYHRWLLDAFDKRIQGDYGLETVLTAEDAQTMIAQAEEFLEAGRSNLGLQARTRRGRDKDV